MSEPRASEIIEQWKAEGQEHLFESWGKRSPERKERLLADLDSLDRRLYRRLVEEIEKGKARVRQHEFEPISFIPRESWQQDRYARERGEELIRAGKAAFLTVAGGQGSRLDFDGPKGCFPISPLRKASLFQLLAEKLLAARQRYRRPLYWYIMTSPLNLEQTRSFFRENEFFGLAEQEVLFFTQGLFPTMSREGKLVLAEDGGLFKNPNGHGGTIQALRDSGCLEHMNSQGSEEIFYFQVDNPLVRIPDPYFLGVHRAGGSQMSTKVIPKAYPEEKIGAIGRIDGKPGVIEYSDLDEQRMYARDEQGRLLFSHGSIAIHILSVSFVASAGLELPLHQAEKTIEAWIPDQGNGRIQGREAVKFEMFIFDAIPLARNPLFVETSREVEFAPLKNRIGQDSIETCRQGMIDLQASWLEQAGVVVPRDKSGQPLCRVEISPLYAVDVQSLKKRLAGTVNRIDEDTLYI